MWNIDQSLQTLLYSQELLRKTQQQQFSGITASQLRSLNNAHLEDLLSLRTLQGTQISLAGPSMPVSPISHQSMSMLEQAAIRRAADLRATRLELERLLLLRQYHEEAHMRHGDSSHQLNASTPEIANWPHMLTVMKSVALGGNKRPDTSRIPRASAHNALHSFSASSAIETHHVNEVKTDSANKSPYSSFESDGDSMESDTEQPNTNASSSQKPRKKNSKWLATFNVLKKYKEENGDCIVPRGYSLNPKLASWVAEQRKQYKLYKDGKQSSITCERIALLNGLDFAWNAQEAAWTRHMQDLKKFIAEVGHCHVPLNHPKYPKLGLWVKEQRRHYALLKQGKQSHMTKERAQELDQVGFCWDTHEATWLDRLRDLAEYKEKHGNCIVPTNYSENPKLGTWVHHQRRQYKKFKEGKPCHITEERIKALESLGFVWYPRDRSQSANESLGDCSDSESDTESLDSRPSKRQRSA